VDPHGERTLTIGGDRPIPAPDPIARDYLLLALRVSKLLPGLVDAYFGPADLKAGVEAESPRTAGKLREDASALTERLSREVAEPDRQRWLRAQLVALEAQTLMVAGDPLPYSDYLACLFDAEPERTPESLFESAADDLARLLPCGEKLSETVADRLAAWDARFRIALNRLPAVVDWLVGQVRDRADRLLGLPVGEKIEFVYVSGGPWSAFNQYEGGGRSLIEVNTEVMCTPARLIGMAAHECYPGRHTEHAWRERRIVGEMGRPEASVAMLNTPEALISEGLAYLGERMVAPDEAMADLLVELYSRGGLAVAADPSAARDAAEKQVRIQHALASLRPVTANAAFMLHADGAPKEEVVAYLRRYLPTGPERAERQLALIEDPICRAQVVVGPEGERLLRRWFELGPTTEQVDRFGRLLREQLTPGSISAELSSLGFGGSVW
jgi:hypothetical protein